jgi:AcrR family transcriptional regulator
MARGRPRNFDETQALDRALELFWSRGYEGTSLEDLTQAMGMNRPSLYATFGCKEQLFRRALDRYAEGPAAYMAAALDAPTGREVLRRILEGTLQLLSDPRYPAGCLAVHAALACGQEAQMIREELCRRRAQTQQALIERLTRAEQAGEWPEGSAETLACFVMTVVYGLAVQAKSGASGETLRRVAERALRCCEGA